MRYLVAISLTLLFAAASASAQNGPRAFDNFDRSQGVQVLVGTPEPIVAKAVTKRKRKGNKWVVVVEDKLVKPTTQSRPRGWALKVTDGLANTSVTTPIRDLKFTSAGGSYLKGFTTGDLIIDSYIVDSSRRYGIDPLLIYSQMHQESSFKLTARSNKGASGLMQLMPGTARRFGVTKIYDPKQNIDAGVRYMRWLLDLFGGDVSLALAGYNAGEGAVLKYGGNIPPYRETQEYVRRISSRYNSIADGKFIQTARRVDLQTATRLEAKESRPLAVYEPNPVAIRLPDGKLTLINQ